MHNEKTMNIIKKHLTIIFNKSHLFIFLKPYLRKSKLSVKVYAPWHIKTHLQTISFFSQFLKKGDLCFDIGANIGEYTRNLLYLKVKVVSVEPQKKCLKTLYEMYGRNKNVKIVGKAAGELEEYASMYISDKYGKISTLSNKWKDYGRFSRTFEWNKEELVPVTTLDSLIRRFGLPKFCKIDVEGYELNVLKGLTQKIPILSFEFTKEFSKDITLCGEYLKSLGDVRFNLIYGNTFKFLLTNWISIEGLLNFLNKHPDIDWGDIYAKFI